MADAGKLSSKAKRRIYRVLCYITHCDGDVDPREREVLAAYQARFGLSDAEARALESEGADVKQLRLGGKSLEIAELIKGMVEVVAADGMFALDEEKKLLKLAHALGVPEGMILQRVDEALRALGAKRPGGSEDDPDHPAQRLGAETGFILDEEA